MTWREQKAGNLSLITLVIHNLECRDSVGKSTPSDYRPAMTFFIPLGPICTLSISILITLICLEFRGNVDERR